MNLNRKKVTWMILIIAMVINFLSTNIPIVRDHVMVFLIGIFALFTILGKLSRTREYARISAVLLLIFLAVYLITIRFNAQYSPEVTPQSIIALRTASVVAFIFLSLTLLIGPITRMRKKYSTYKYRRALGVTVLLLAAFHVSSALGIYYDQDLAKAFSSQGSLFILLGFTAWIILIFLGITSWDAVQKHVKKRNFNIFYTLVFLTYLLYLSWFYLANHTFYGKGWFFSLVVIYWISIAPWSPLIVKTQENVDPWRQMHLRIWIVYASLIFHISIVLQSMQMLWTQVVFYSIIFLVLGTHSLGILLRIKEELKLRERYRSLGEPIKENGETYYPAIAMDEFKQNEGKKVLIIPLKAYLSIHKLNTEYYAFSAYCAHQKGPLDKGRIVGTYVVCPWHQWSFNIHTGCRPGQSGSIAVYTTLVKNNIVYIKERLKTRSEKV